MKKSIIFLILLLVFITSCRYPGDIHADVPSDCENQADQGHKDLCYYSQAKKWQNVSICEKIQSDEHKRICLDEFKE
jgi:hypothetical protein